MEIKVRCRKEEGTWIIEDPGQMFVRELRVVWTFEGLEPDIIPLIVFNDNPPQGPFPDAWLTASTIVAELESLPIKKTVYDYDIVLIQWTPEEGRVVAQRTHKLSLENRPPVRIKVSWKGPGNEVVVDPDACTVGSDCPVEWSFEVPEDVFATIDFGSLDRGKGPRPMGPFPELHGRRENGLYRLTGQTDLVKDGYKYTVTLYDRKSGRVILRHDPKIDNNGDPIG